jgi:hypothetical protein
VNVLRGVRAVGRRKMQVKHPKDKIQLYKMKKSLEDWTPNSEPTLKFIDFKLGNVCNLKCRICGSWSSSKWAQEELEYGENPVALKNLREGGWPKKNPQFFEDLKEDLAHVEYFEFTGGEPFMIKDHFKILMHCVEKGYAKNIDIHYNTNGTQLPPQEIFDLWSCFKHVEIAFSIDDVGNSSSTRDILQTGGKSTPTSSSSRNARQETWTSRYAQQYHIQCVQLGQDSTVGGTVPTQVLLREHLFRPRLLQRTDTAPTGQGHS